MSTLKPVPFEAAKVSNVLNLAAELIATRQVGSGLWYAGGVMTAVPKRRVRVVGSHAVVAPQASTPQ